MPHFVKIPCKLWQAPVSRLQRAAVFSLGKETLASSGETGHRFCLKTFRITKIQHCTKHTSTFLSAFTCMTLTVLCYHVRFISCITAGNWNKKHRKKLMGRMNRWIKWLIQPVKDWGLRLTMPFLNRKSKWWLLLPDTLHNSSIC